MSRCDPYREKIIEDLREQIHQLERQNDTLNDELRDLTKNDLTRQHRQIQRLEKEMREWRKWAVTAKKMYAVFAAKANLDDSIALPLDPSEDPVD